MSKTATYIKAIKKHLLKSRGPAPDSLTWKKCRFNVDKISSQESLTDPDCAPEFATSVSTPGTGSHVRDRVVTLYYLFLGFIACLNLQNSPE